MPVATAYSEGSEEEATLAGEAKAAPAGCERVHHPVMAPLAASKQETVKQETLEAPVRLVTAVHRVETKGAAVRAVAVVADRSGIF